MNRVFDARRKPIPLDLPEPLPLPSSTDLAVMVRHGIKLPDWWNMTDSERVAARLSVAHAEPRTP
ncbi:hypothetical protein PP634_gp67 [Arthrobacter phage Richie]|uniref:Uncharacterized protein n=1 Tax=Arthrobacter phage Richie TaxID=2419967 RepID=A0A3G2KIR9_9CAUD|nr:hypothetical protein PP634_gp67 [Arthrobacter phage Richie]AYN58893.1 hypothetical protein PBI_RICHIE_67 [Arthrobacter phage Richie]